MTSTHMNGEHAEAAEAGIAITRADVERVHRLIAPYIRRTPVVDVDGRDLGIAHDRVTLKLEQLQRAGSFKTRGAFTHLLTRPVPPAGVVAASGGNHGAAVAFAAMTMKVPAKIFVPVVSSPAKIDRIRSYGADLEVGGDRYADAFAASERWAEQSGALQVHAFDQPETLLGQATLGLELDQQATLDTVLIAVGGGGLIGGIAAWYAGRVRIVGVEPELAPTLTDALKAGRPVDAPAGGIAADSLAPRRVGELMFPIARAYLHGVVLVTDEAIQEAQRAMWDAARIAVEPGGAAACAALRSGAYRPSPGERVGIVVSGGNTAAVRFD